ncbi:hypothetical protein B0H14DRAFT_2608215 [Mycena olivaceomarginata]|nr:hypothetical protein B0H14DRAFT_2608215 [Mycena olivaceomarginata]
MAPQTRLLGGKKFLVLRPCILHCPWCRRSSGHKHPKPRLCWEVHHMILHLGDVHIIPLAAAPTLWLGQGAGSSLLLTPGPRGSMHHAVGLLHTTLWLGQSASPSRMCACRPTGPPCLYGCTIALLPRGGQVVPLFLPIAAPRLQGSIIYTPLQPPTFSSYIPGPSQAQNVRGKINPNHVTRKEIQVRNEERKKLAGMGGKDRP